MAIEKIKSVKEKTFIFREVRWSASVGVITKIIDPECPLKLKKKNLLNTPKQLFP